MGSVMKELGRQLPGFSIRPPMRLARQCGPDIVHVIALKTIRRSRTVHAVPVLAVILPKVEEILSAVTPEATGGLTLAVSARVLSGIAPSPKKPKDATPEFMAMDAWSALKPCWESYFALRADVRAIEMSLNANLDAPVIDAVDPYCRATVGVSLAWLLESRPLADLVHLYKTKLDTFFHPTIDSIVAHCQSRL
jgi:hypothetical protein